MRAMAIWSMATAAAAAGLGLWVLVWWYGIADYRPVFRAHSPQTTEFVRTTSDLESLRTLTQMQMRQTEELQRDANAILDNAINMIVGLFLFCAFLALVGWVNAVRAQRMALGASMPRWLRWL